ncbi:NAD+ synthase [Methanobrevibacter sp. OttesenSCG-928-K11]|nr:NAD+ synthase [Methanobrevibacter sp. OttesenSCG-928-K11]
MNNVPTLDSKTSRKEIIDFIKAKVNDANGKGIVVGLSGGIDSSITAYLACEAVGKENVLGILLPSSTTPKEDNSHGKLIAEKLGIDYFTIAIDSILEEYLKEMYVENDDSKIAIGNLKARIRMSILYFYANLKNYLVGGTSNKSEISIGYFTKHGDGACDIKPIGELYKTQIRELARQWEIPEEIISKPPRAGLWENQSDEDEIGMPYEILDRILYMLIDEKMDANSIADILEISIKDVERIEAKVQNNMHKNKIPDSPENSEKSFS